VGIGIARRSGRFTYTAIFTRSRDKTSPHVVIDDATWQPEARSSEVSIEWRGVDPQLAMGTAGIRRFDVERFTVSDGWSQIDGDPHESERTVRTYASGAQRFRIRAVDKAGNVGPWAYTRIDIPGYVPARA
jgi:hypothetical protein